MFLTHNDLRLGNLEILPQIIVHEDLNHKPIALILQEVEDIGPIPFYFNPLWLQDPIVYELI